ncbi:hypothetical protein MMC07_002908 [Pseudocyphellaria aurata]|nr:hypothetical protein [Pseudocyphellaria aurata]
MAVQAGNLHIEITELIGFMEGKNIKCYNNATTKANQVKAIVQLKSKLESRSNRGKRRGSNPPTAAPQPTPQRLKAEHLKVLDNPPIISSIERVTHSPNIKFEHEVASWATTMAIQSFLKASIGADEDEAQRSDDVANTALRTAHQRQRKLNQKSTKASRKALASGLPKKRPAENSPLAKTARTKEYGARQRPNQTIRAYAAYLDELATRLSNAPTDKERLQKLQTSMKESVCRVIKMQSIRPTTRADLIAQAQRIEEIERADSKDSRKRSTYRAVRFTAAQNKDIQTWFVNYKQALRALDIGTDGKRVINFDEAGF